MYAAAQAKPQSNDAEHLGPAPISGPHLVATYKPGREIYAQDDLNDKCYQVSTGAVRRLVVSFHLPKPSTETTPGRLRALKEITWQLCARLGSATRGYTQVYNLQSALALTWAHRTHRFGDIDGSVELAWHLPSAFS